MSTTTCWLTPATLERTTALGQRHTERFLADMAGLNWLAPDVYARATEHLPQMVEMIERLLEVGAAYVGDDHVYLAATADPRGDRSPTFRRDSARHGQRARQPA